MSYKKELILVRGVSGAGKTSFVETMMFLHQQYDNTIVEEVSADKYFIDEDGIYNFKKHELPLAHKFSQDCVKMLMSNIAKHEDNARSVNDYINPKIFYKKFNHFIFVHNTFTQEWEMKPYYELAKIYNYKVTTIIIENRHESKSIHDVPEIAIQSQKDRFEIML
tara:strand:+ start:1058 stop:1552 length:495 start_codon:yes stop_codon:yes gene_type:complete